MSETAVIKRSREVDRALDTDGSPPIAGKGTETFAFVNGWSWCGECGYTGRVRGPRQAACKQWIWHRWLEHCHDLSTFAFRPAPSAPSRPVAVEQANAREFGADDHAR